MLCIEIALVSMLHISEMLSFSTLHIFQIPLFSHTHTSVTCIYRFSQSSQHAFTSLSSARSDGSDRLPGGIKPSADCDHLAQGQRGDRLHPVTAHESE